MDAKVMDQDCLEGYASLNWKQKFKHIYLIGTVISVYLTKESFVG